LCDRSRAGTHITNYAIRRAGCTAIGELKRSDFGVDFNAVLEAGGVVVGDRVDIYLESTHQIRRAR